MREFRKIFLKSLRVRAQLQVQANAVNRTVESINIKRFIELQIRGQAIRFDWCEVEPIYVYFCFAASQLAENSQTSNLSTIVTRHRSTAELHSRCHRD